MKSIPVEQLDERLTEALEQQDEHEAIRLTPAFGAGRGTLTILEEDEEHLKDFQEYME